MEMNETRVIAAPRDIVWAALLDRDVLKYCVPGCTEMEGTAEDGFTATVVQKVGPVKATFKGTVTLSEMAPPDRVILTGEGKGGAAGFAKGQAEVALVEVADGTELAYHVSAKVGGKLAQLGSRVIDGFAKKMADQFFTNFQRAVEPPVESAPEPQEDAPADAPAKGWFRRMMSS